MEARKNTTAGVLHWTPAPVRPSPSSSEISEDEWEDEEEDQAQRDEDFVSQMDENGIIGLSEALQDAELERTCEDEDVDCSANPEPGGSAPEEEDPSENEMELSINRKYVSNIESPADDVILSLFDDYMYNLKAQTTNEEVTQRKDERMKGFPPESDKYLDMSEEEISCKRKGKKSDRKKHKHEFGIKNCSAESHTANREIVKTSSTKSCSDDFDTQTFGASNYYCQVAHPASSVTPQILPHLLHFTAEEITAAPGIEAETLPDMSSAESSQESPRSHTSLKSSPRSEIKLRNSSQPAAMFSKDIASDTQSKRTNGPIKGMVKLDKHSPQSVPSPTKTNGLFPKATYCRTPRADSLRQITGSKKKQRASGERGAAKTNESRKEPLSHRTPNFSKVEPRVRFPKDGYIPPKSRCSVNMESLSLKLPVVFKSPAEIVKEVLLNTNDGSPRDGGSHRPTSTDPLSIVPQEFKCQQQATTLMEQLQEDYNRLLTRCAEAENTIDRMRLEAKVNMYSDPPKPGHLVPPGLNRDPSKVMMLDFPRAQRAEINSAYHHSSGLSPNQRSQLACPSISRPGSQFGQQLAKILFSQAEKFLQQLQTFEDLLKNKPLKPDEQMKGISQLAEGLDSLERGYLLARDKHKLMLQLGAEIGHFDPERELEGLVFQCGLGMEAVKEQVEMMQNEHHPCEAPPSQQPQLMVSPVPSDGGETLTLIQSPPAPSLAYSREPAAEVDVTSAIKKGKEESLDSFYLKPVDDKHRCVEQDFSKSVDHHQSSEDQLGISDQSKVDGVPHPADRITEIQPGIVGKGRTNQGTGTVEVHKSPPQRQTTHQDSAQACSSKQQTSRSIPASGRASSQSISPPVPPSTRRRAEKRKPHSSSLSSLGEITASEKGLNRVPSQDGIISPEVDSGFVGSESSRLTPAAAPSPLLQRASESSVSVPQEGNSVKSQTGPASALSAAFSLSHSQTAVENRRGSQLSRDQTRRSKQRQRRRMFSCSPRRQIYQSEKSSETSEFALESDSTVSEGRRSDGHSDYVSSIHSCRSSSSPAPRYHHAESLGELSSSQVAKRNAAIQTLQAEVNRLREKLESCSKNLKSTSPQRAVPLVHESHIHINTSTAPDRSCEPWSGGSSVRRVRHTDDETEDSTMRRTTRKRPTSAHRQRGHSYIYTEPSKSEPHPLVSRSTQTSTAAGENHYSHTSTVHSRTQTRQHPAVSETTDEPDCRSRSAPLCPLCLSRCPGQPKAVNGREQVHSSQCHHCHVCRCTEPNRSTEPVRHRVSNSNKHTSCESAQSHPIDENSRRLTATSPASPTHCMPVYPPPLLFYSLPVYVPPSNNKGKSSGFRGQGEVKVRMRRSQSAERQLFVDDSLNRAIRAARHMKHTSGHMARSLASGLQYQELIMASNSN